MTETPPTTPPEHPVKPHSSTHDVQPYPGNHPYIPTSYGPHPLQTYHALPSLNPRAITILFIHGGAFRHPPMAPSFTCTPAAGLPLLELIRAEFGSGLPYPTSDAKVHLISTGYRLAGPHPTYGGLAPYVHWHGMMADLQAVWDRCIPNSGGDARGPVVVVGHSVGALLGLELLGRRGGERDVLIGIEGIYNLPALLQEYPDYRGWVESGLGCAVENGIVNGAQGWRGRVVKIWSEEDELLGKGQAECKVIGYDNKVEIRRGNWGGHDECLENGRVEEGIGKEVVQIIGEVVASLDRKGGCAFV
ncbi:hypothetical protein BJ508DRAFT_416384 [Ascobolus immersus RN42]|uniref:Alpha/beta-hydrolase n=1 Tax=Ascobolus immersus RN42 TaxID=1160509 RepID=A0A3N4HY68_ASCIM|nr:hypothetical protein BJ508DRAFT_416384 [Ascobolus immersus RN42]